MERESDMTQDQVTELQDQITELQDQITELKDFVHREIGRSELKMMQQMQQLREQLPGQIREQTREQLQSFKLEMTQQFQAAKVEMVKWVVGLFIGSIIVVSSGLGVYTSVLMNI